jgi:hypothetical protein
MPCCLLHELDGKSLVERMLEVQSDYAMDDDRSTAWFDQLKCLSVRPCTSGKILDLAIINPDTSDPMDFVAVSYSFESAHKFLETPPVDVVIHDPEGSIKHFETRKSVLRRVLSYTKYRDTPFFWIDRECIDQAERQAAMDSMDLVYQRCHYPVALLEMTFGSSQVDLMSLLMSGSSLWGRKVDSMVDMLRLVQADRWWERAWTFQEEYLAGRDMDLLIPHASEPGEHRETALTEIEGEVCVSATEFRERATDFLLELSKSERQKHELREICKSLLDTFRRYNIVAETTESAMGRAMSTMVLGDLERRAITKPFDFIPIAANVCNYSVRLHSNRLGKGPHSLGLCALTMYLLNGEILKNDGEITVLPTEMTLSRYLEHISFSRFVPPPSEKRLSWLKECRLWPVTLAEEGVLTSGHLWHIHTEIRTSGWKLVQSSSCGSRSFGLNTYQRNRLNQLRNKVKQIGACKTLWLQLGQYLDQDKGNRNPPTLARLYMNLMAEEVVEAIRGSRSLFLATLKGPRQGSAIFAMDHVNHNANLARNSKQLTSPVKGVSAFTSWSSDHHVSMTIDLAETTSKPKLPLMTMTGWTNGLAFYYDAPLQDTVVRWPKAWKRRNKRRLAGVERDGAGLKFQRTR